MPAGMECRPKVGLLDDEAPPTTVVAALLLARPPPTANVSEEDMGTLPVAMGFAEKDDVDDSECEEEACKGDGDAVEKLSNGDEERRPRASLMAGITAADGGCTRRQRASEEKGRELVSRSRIAADLRKKYAW